MGDLNNFDFPDVMSPVTGTFTKISGTGNPPPNESSTGPSLIKRGYYFGAKTRNFNRLLESGHALPLQTYARSDYTEIRGPQRYWGTNKGPNPKFSYLGLGPSPSCSGHSFGSYQESLGKCYEMTKSVNLVALQQEAFAKILPELDVLTTAAEIPKTLRMILGARKRALGLINQALRSGFRSPKAIIAGPVKAGSSAWLEWRYGWRLLAYDCEAFVEAWNNPYRRNILKGKAERLFTEMQTTTTTGGGYYCLYDRVNDISRSCHVIVRAVAEYDSRAVNQLSSIPVSAWELIPFSFVADWFVSVGDVIGAWRVLAAATRHYSSLGFRLNESIRMVIQNPRLGSGSQAIAPYGATGSSTLEGVFKHRLPLGSPSFLPQLRVELTNARIADAASLLVGFNKSIIR